MRRIILFSWILLAGILWGCSNQPGSQGHTHDVIGGQATGGDHVHETSSLSYTLFEGDYELFVEFPPLVVGQTSSFAAHFTDLRDYSPVDQGKLTVSLIKGSNGIRHTVDGPASPGIFRPALQPKEPGNYRLMFEMVNENDTVVFQIDPVEVYADEEAALHRPQEAENGDEITFLKEQAWYTDFETREVVESTFHAVIHTSARVNSQPQSEKVLSAQSSGIVSMIALQGESVERGDLLALITAAGFENNLNVRLNESRISFEKSRADYIRTKPLAEIKSISQKDFLAIRSRYLQDSVRYYQMEENISQNGLNIRAPFNGYVSQILTENGAFVETGTPVIKVNNKNQVLIEAYVDQADYGMVDGITDAHLRLPAGNRIIQLSTLNGEVKTSQAFVNPGSTRIPVTFIATNNGELMPGMYLEVFLLADQKHNVLVIPLSAVLEEQGQYAVYVQTGGESFLKRPIILGNSDGMNVEITSGLHPGERIVTRGSYQIKLAAMSGELPLHGHTH